MASPVRNVTGTLATEITLQHTRPFRIVSITLANGTAYYYSEGPLFNDGSHNYMPGRVRVSDFTWDADGTQTGTVEVLENNSEMESMVVNNTFAEATVVISQVYYRADGSFTVPLVIVQGSCDGIAWTPTAATLTIVTSTLATQFVPTLFITPANGFNNLIPEMTVVYFNGISYLIDVEVD